jgi:hypothetical protein
MRRAAEYKPGLRVATSLFAEGKAPATVSCYGYQKQLEDARMWWAILIVSVASLPLAAAMAVERDRSAKFWVWIALVVGPLAPLALLLLGQAKRLSPTSSPG